MFPNPGGLHVGVCVRIQSITWDVTVGKECTQQISALSPPPLSPQLTLATLFHHHLLASCNVYGVLVPPVQVGCMCVFVC